MRLHRQVARHIDMIINKMTFLTKRSQTRQYEFEEIYYKSGAFYCYYVEKNDPSVERSWFLKGLVTVKFL
jgi:hypothetical protein